MKPYDEIDLEEHFSLANEGKRVWETVESKFDADLYILFPHRAEVYNYFALLYLDEYIEAKRAQRVLLISSEKVIGDALPVFSKSNAQFCRMELENIQAVIKYYALYEFSSKLTIISLKTPYDTCGENLLGVKGVTKEDLLCWDIYRFDQIPQKLRPFYSGTDEEMLRFMKLGS